MHSGRHGMPLQQSRPSSAPPSKSRSVGSLHPRTPTAKGPFAAAHTGSPVRRSSTERDKAPLTRRKTDVAAQSKRDVQLQEEGNQMRHRLSPKRPSSATMSSSAGKVGSLRAACAAATADSESVRPTSTSRQKRHSDSATPPQRGGSSRVQSSSNTPITRGSKAGSADTSGGAGGRRRASSGASAVPSNTSSRRTSVTSEMRSSSSIVGCSVFASGLDKMRRSESTPVVYEQVDLTFSENTSESSHPVEFRASAVFDRDPASVLSDVRSALGLSSHYKPRIAVSQTCDGTSMTIPETMARSSSASSGYVDVGPGGESSQASVTVTIGLDDPAASSPHRMKTGSISSKAYLRDHKRCQRAEDNLSDARIEHIKSELRYKHLCHIGEANHWAEALELPTRYSPHTRESDQEVVCLVEEHGKIINEISFECFEKRYAALQSRWCIRGLATERGGKGRQTHSAAVCDVTINNSAAALSGAKHPPPTEVPSSTSGIAEPKKQTDEFVPSCGQEALQLRIRDVTLETLALADRMRQQLEMLKVKVPPISPFVVH